MNITNCSGTPKISIVLTMLPTLAFFALGAPAYAQSAAPRTDTAPAYAQNTAAQTTTTETITTETQTESPAVTSDQPPANDKTSKMRSRISRGTSSAQFHFIYSPLDLFIPQKIGISGSYIATAQKTYEFEYLRGKIAAPSFFKDLGRMTDEKISILARNYFSRNSFNLSYGVTYFRFKVHLGSEYLQSVTASERANVDVLNLESLGVNVGVGNRWAVTEHISFGVDWIELYQPLVETKRETGFVDKTNDNSDRDAVEDALDYITKFPRFTFFKVSLGATF